MTKIKFIFSLPALLLCFSVQASEFEWATGFAVGDTFPDSQLIAIDGKKTLISSVAGDNGYLVVFNRSVVW